MFYVYVLHVLQLPTEMFQQTQHNDDVKLNKSHFNLWLRILKEANYTQPKAKSRKFNGKNNEILYFYTFVLSKMKKIILHINTIYYCCCKLYFWEFSDLFLN